MAHVTDDLGRTLSLPARVNRVVSLVPSLTEAVALADPDALVGATAWCSRPAGLDVARVRGTKNPDVRAIVDLRPDLVLANKEENRRKDVDALSAAGVPVWVTVVEDVPQALDSLGRLFDVALDRPRPDWLADAQQRLGGPPPAPVASVAIPVWRDPWMVVGSATFAGSLAAHAGLANVFATSPERYPHVSARDIQDARPDLVLLPDEPYAFSEQDGPEAFPQLPSALVEGRALTWYGPSLASAVDVLRAAVEARR